MYFTHLRNFIRGMGFVLPCILLLPACLPAQDPDAISPSMAVYFETVGQGQSMVLTDTLEVVVRDSAAWMALAGQLETLLPMKPIDFGQSMALVAAVPTSMGGSSVVFASVEDDGSTLIATYMVGIPGWDCRIIDGRTVPFQVVVVPRSEAPVRFEHAQEPYPCTMQ